MTIPADLGTLSVTLRPSARSRICWVSLTTTGTLGRCPAFRHAEHSRANKCETEATRRSSRLPKRPRTSTSNCSRLSLRAPPSPRHRSRSMRTSDSTTTRATQTQPFVVFRYTLSMIHFLRPNAPHFTLDFPARSPSPPSLLLQHAHLSSFRGRDSSATRTC